MSEKNQRGALIIVSAPSGCGKSTLLHRLMEKREKLRFSVSATTRPPREGEVDGKDYFFVDHPTFERMIAEDAFLEHAEYVGNHYGTPRAAVEELLDAGYDVYLDIDVQGAMQIKRIRPETLTIFVTPPSLPELENRLRSRGTDSDEVIRSRLEAAERELILKDHYDYVVVNDEVDRAAGEISDLIDSYKARLSQKD
mgnify:CR=1 FL=1